MKFCINIKFSYIKAKRVIKSFEYLNSNNKKIRSTKRIIRFKGDVFKMANLIGNNYMVKRQINY